MKLLRISGYWVLFSINPWGFRTALWSADMSGVSESQEINGVYMSATRQT